MPTLATDLTPQQRAWLFETFGHYGESDELQQVTAGSHYHHHPSYPGRRFSDAHRVGSDPYQYYHYPVPPYHHDEPEYSPENRNSIFRRGGRHPAIPLDPHPQEPPISWSPTDRTDNHHYNRGLHLRQPFRRSNSRTGHVEDPIPKRVADVEAKRAPPYPHTEDKLTWQQSYENLKVYKRTYGDCNVPQKYRHNVKLGGWVNKQRKKKKNPAKYGKLSDNQISDLEGMGFKWILDNCC